MTQKPVIITLTGRSGSGKTTAAEYIETIYGIKMIESHTDRPPRYPGEKGHTFWSKEEFDQFKREDMIAFTEFGGHRYCCLKQDVNPINTYVIDEHGVEYLKSNYGDAYHIITIYVHRRDGLRAADDHRKKRDEKMYWLTPNAYDYVIDNNQSLGWFHSQVLSVIGDLTVTNNIYLR